MRRTGDDGVGHASPDTVTTTEIRAWYHALPAEPRDYAHQLLSSVKRRRRRGIHRRLSAAALTIILVASALLRIRKHETPVRYQWSVHLTDQTAGTVEVVGDFTSWQRPGLTLARDGSTGRWTGEIALEPGLHRYAYIVNGQPWVVDPAAPVVEDNLLGATNALVVAANR